MPAAPGIDIDALGVLLTRGAIPDSSDEFGQTPLWWCIFHGCLQSLQMLLDAGADVNLRPWDRTWVTPLMWAIFFNRQHMIETLMKAGAEITCWHKPHLIDAILWAKLHPMVSTHTRTHTHVVNLFNLAVQRRVARGCPTHEPGWQARLQAGVCLHH